MVDRERVGVGMDARLRRNAKGATVAGFVHVARNGAEITRCT